MQDRTRSRQPCSPLAVPPPARVRRDGRQPTTEGWVAIIVFGFLAGLGIIAALAAVGVYVALASDLAPPRPELTQYQLPEETVIYDRTGKTELARFGGAKREVVTFDQIPPILLDATTAVEDKTFWDNAGFDPVAIVSAGLELAPWRQPGRLDDHPAAGPGAAARPGARPGSPTGPSNASSRRSSSRSGSPRRSRARPASGTSSPPTSTRTTTATRPTA